MDRLLIILVTLVISNAAFADYSPKAIYEALDVPEFHLNPGIAGHSRIEKSVGGLTCIKSRLINPNSEPFYECDLILEEDFIPVDLEQGFPVQ